MLHCCSTNVYTIVAETDTHCGGDFVIIATWQKHKFTHVFYAFIHRSAWPPLRRAIRSPRSCTRARERFCASAWRSGDGVRKNSKRKQDDGKYIIDRQWTAANRYPAATHNISELNVSVDLSNNSITTHRRVKTWQNTHTHIRSRGGCPPQRNVRLAVFRFCVAYPKQQGTAADMLYGLYWPRVAEHIAPTRDVECLRAGASSLPSVECFWMRNLIDFWIFIHVRIWSINAFLWTHTAHKNYSKEFCDCLAANLVLYRLYQPTSHTLIVYTCFICAKISDEECVSNAQTRQCKTPLETICHAQSHYHHIPFIWISITTYITELYHSTYKRTKTTTRIYVYRKGSHNTLFLRNQHRFHEVFSARNANGVY